MKEYRDLTADPLQDTITAGPVSEDNMLQWEALIQGPEGTPYVSTEARRPGLWQEGGVFAAKLVFVSHQLSSRAEEQPPDYPLNPFTMTFDPPLLHPNSSLRPTRSIADSSLLDRSRLHLDPSSSGR